MNKIITLCGILGALAMHVNAAELGGFSLPADAQAIINFSAELVPPVPAVVPAAKPLSLNDLKEPTDPQIKLGMYNNLKAAGIKLPFTDVRELAGTGAKNILLKHGFKLQSGQQGMTVYTLGNAQLDGTGQRAVINADGSELLVCFSQPSGGHPLLEIITIDAAGTVSNSVTMVP